MCYSIMPVGLVLSSLILVFIFYRRFPQGARLVLALVIVFLYLMSTRFGAYHLGKIIGSADPIEYPALSLTSLPSIDPTTTAIVVLGYGRYKNALEYGGRDIINRYGLERILYASRLHRITNAPILLTGNSGGGNEKVSEAELMQEVLLQDFGLKQDIWLETKSSSTYENAKFSTEILKAKSIKTIIIVAYRGHMPRAVRVFEQFGFKIIPAPLGQPWAKIIWDYTSFLPIAANLVTSTGYWHQFVATVYYKVTGKIKSN